MSHDPREGSVPTSGLPPLARVERIARPVSMPEYYQASVGASGRTLEQARENGFCVEAEGQLPAARWQAALDAVTRDNPGARLRMLDEGRRARWDSDGLPPRLRLVDDSDWDGRSDVGAEVIYATPLALATGPTVELLVIARPAGRSLLVVRSLHAVMDGLGTLHFLHELFRALRGEPLLGTNAAFSDVDLMRSVGVTRTTSKHVKTVALTGLPHGDDVGDTWRRLSLGKPRKNQLGLVAEAVAEFTHRHTTLPALIAVPVDLRRHAPELRSTANYATMLLVRLDPGEGGDAFKQRLKAMLEAKMDAVYPRFLDLVRWFSLARLDLMASRTAKNYRTRKPLETAVISNLGRQDAGLLGCDGFRATRFFVIPLKGSVFLAMACIADELELTINVPRVLASDGRLDAFLELLVAKLGAP
jgi:hypothetical protein